MGRRFIDESICHDHHLSSHAVARQPEGICYTVFDDKAMQQMVVETKDPELNLKNFRGGPRRLRGKEAEAIKDPLKIFASLEELIDWVGCDFNVLKATIDEYNTSCDQGYDHVFAKEPKYLQPLRTPPYYAIKRYLALVTTIGGIKINHHMEVLNQEDNPIPGLYAAGIDTGGWESDTYCVRLAGTTFGFAINSGRIAGENAAKYVEGGNLS